MSVVPKDKKDQRGRFKKKKKKKKKKSKKNRQGAAANVGKTSNWEALKEQLAGKGERGTNGGGKKKRKRAALPSVTQENSGPDAQKSMQDLFPEKSKYVACDCEMVGVGMARVSALARASLVDWNGQVLYDKFVRPKEKITDYRTRVSGVRRRDMTTALSFDRAQTEVAAILKGKILVGHALKNDTAALKIHDHPEADIRDTALYRPLLKQHANGSWRPKSLRALAAELGEIIQTGEHSSVEDARASMMVFRKYRDAWERSLLNGTNQKKRKLNPPRHAGPVGDIFSSKAKRAKSATKKISRKQRRHRERAQHAV